ncbi:hypothetical protein ACC686_36195, partial [Rhizobium johnstonii]|uniref:hypothetical protein n=1 Tax=Rhizobium johnstonii TaxID=3019933 RepID=UPI003F9DAE31
MPNNPTRLRSFTANVRTAQLPRAIGTASARNSAAAREQGEVMSSYTELAKKQDVPILHSPGYAQDLAKR